jgi:hypothetical protein
VNRDVPRSSAVAQQVDDAIQGLVDADSWEKEHAVKTPGRCPTYSRRARRGWCIADADDIYKAVGSRMSGRGKPWKVRVGVKDAAGRVYAVRTTLS